MCPKERVLRNRFLPNDKKNGKKEQKKCHKLFLFYTKTLEKSSVEKTNGPYE